MSIVHGTGPGLAIRPAFRMAARLTSGASSAGRFASTFLLLCGDFARTRGHRFWLMTAAVLLVGFLAPLPLLVLVALVRSAQAGQGLLTLGPWTVTHDAGVFAVFLFGLLAIVLHYAVSRWVQTETLAWQDAVFQRLSTNPAVDVGAPAQPARQAARLLGAVRSGFLMGRLLETGLRDAAIVLAGLGILLLLDARSLAVLGFITLLFLPVYALALSDLVRQQGKAVRGANQAQRALADHFRTDGGPLTAAKAQTLRPGYVSALSQIAGLSAITAVAGIHLFASFFAVYVADGGGMATLPKGKLLFFIVLVVMLRSLQGLVGLVSRLSRGYENLGLLRSLLFPATGPAAAQLPMPTLPAELLPGDRLLFLVPYFQARHLLQLRPLLGLGPHQALPLLDAGSLMVGSKALPEASVVALTAATARDVAAHPGAAAYLSGRIAVIVIGPGQGAAAHAPWLASGYMTVASDGSVLAGVGSFAAMLEALRTRPEDADDDGGDEAWR